MNECCFRLINECKNELSLKDKRIAFLETEITRVFDPVRKFWHDDKEKERKELYEACQEALNTTYRFIASYKKENNADTGLCLKSAEYHLSQLAQLVFDEADGRAK